MSTATSSRLDRFVGSRAFVGIALAWGFAEATLFFVVPDVLLTLGACRRLDRALRGALLAVAGALAGGALMLLWARSDPVSARAALDAVPGIDPAGIADVRQGLDARGALALLVGPVFGVPYKIFAVEWSARGAGLPAFLLVSVPARFLRFALTALLARGIAAALQRRASRGGSLSIAAWAIAWIGFYLVYFRVKGW